jgi:hypothetical protein
MMCAAACTPTTALRLIGFIVYLQVVASEEPPICTEDSVNLSQFAKLIPVSGGKN